MGRGLAVAVAALLVVASPAAAQGGRLAFELDGEVFTMRADGSERTRLTRTPGEAESGQPDWSPDGSRIAFDFQDETGVHLAIIGADGSGRLALTSAPGVQETPTWSPDGAWITYGAFDPAQPTFSTSIWVVRADGTDARQVTDDGFDVEPVFSPDGTRIAFGRIVGDSPEGQLEALYVVGADGTGLREVVPARPGLEHPDWSPDGRSLTFDIGPETPGTPHAGAIMSVRPDGTGLHVLRAPTETLRFFKARWSPDGKQLLLGCFDAQVRRDRLCTSTRGGGRVSVIDFGDPSWVNYPAWGARP